jgi:hypothetical protein
MDFDASIFLQQAAEMEEEEDDRDREMAAMAAGVIWLGAEEARRLRAERRKRTRLYLCRPQLLPNPRFDTPWRVLYSSKSDRAFITTMGFNVDTFHAIISAGFGSARYSIPIPRSDVSTTGNPRPGARSLAAEGALRLLLHYLNSTMHEISLQQIFALIPTTVAIATWSRALRMERAAIDVTAKLSRRHHRPSQNVYSDFS